MAAYLRERGIRFVIFLHDFLLISDSKDSLLVVITFLIEVLEPLGFISDWIKSVLTPITLLNIWESCGIPILYLRFAN